MSNGNREYGKQENVHPPWWLWLALGEMAVPNKGFLLALARAGHLLTCILFTSLPSNHYVRYDEFWSLSNSTSTNLPMTLPLLGYQSVEVHLYHSKSPSLPFNHYVPYGDNNLEILQIYNHDLFFGWNYMSLYTTFLMLILASGTFRYAHSILSENKYGLTPLVLISIN